MWYRLYHIVDYQKYENDHACPTTTHTFDRAELNVWVSNAEVDISELKFFIILNQSRRSITCFWFPVHALTISFSCYDHVRFLSDLARLKNFCPIHVRYIPFFLNFAKIWPTLVPNHQTCRTFSFIWFERKRLAWIGLKSWFILAEKLQLFMIDPDHSWFC